MRRCVFAARQRASAPGAGSPLAQYERVRANSPLRFGAMPRGAVCSRREARETGGEGGQVEGGRCRILHCESPKGERGQVAGRKADRE